MNINSKLALGFSVLMAGGILLVSSSNADAAFRRAHSSECHSYYDNSGTNVYNGAYLSVSSAASTQGIYCPVATDGYLTHNSTVELNVHGFEASGQNNSSRACVKHYNSTGYACGITKSWGGGNAGVYGVDVNSWRAYGASFPYIYNSIAPGGILYGFYFRN